MRAGQRDGRGLGEALVGDGRPLLSFAGLVLTLCGGFALFQSATGHFLPHDVAYLGMTADALCALQQCRVVHFMIHDRVAFGGSLIAVGTLYLWLTAFPLRRRQAWAWWLLLASGAIGFGSFLTYLGHGYLDAWHGAGTLVLLPAFAGGLARSFTTLRGPRHARTLLAPGVAVPWTSRLGLGRALLLLTGATLVAGGATIMAVGMTSVFVPQDLEFMGMSAAELAAVNPRLVPLIAHDRAGFGGGLCCTGVTVFFCAWCGTPGRGLWQALAVAGMAGFGTAIGIHPLVGYNSVTHLAPAVIAAGVFAAGMALCFGPMFRPDATTARTASAPPLALADPHGVTAR